MTTTMNSTFSQYKCIPTYSSCFQHTVFFQNQFVIIFQTHYKFTSLQIREPEYKDKNKNLWTVSAPVLFDSAEFRLH